MKTVIKIIAVSILISGAFACKSSKQSSNKGTQSGDTKEMSGESGQTKLATGGSYAIAPVVLYKMKNDYSKNVPVGMDDSRQVITSYPGQKDLVGREPTPLVNGYWLDNRGILPNVAFLTYTYEEWINMATLPPLRTMQQNILDADPLLEMYNCGPKSKLGEDIPAALIKEIEESERTGQELPFQRIK